MEIDKTILVTGGAGFIGSAMVRHLISKTNSKVINVDKLTYSGNLQSLTSVKNNKNYPSKAVRPKNSSMSKKKVIKEFNIKTVPWKDSLKRCIDNISN